ncbi:MAG: alpha/beta fold hydrolase [Promethearchaeota archaeon]
MPFAEVNDVKIYYELDGEGPPLMIFHGVRGSHRNWDFLRPHLRETFQLILPDSRGHGQSTELTEPSTIDLYSNDMIALLDHLEIKHAIIAGHSMGGFIAQEFALTAPERLRGLVLIATAPMVDVEGALAQIEVGKLAYGLEPREAVMKLLDFEFVNPEKIRNSPEILNFLIFSAEEGIRLANSHGSAQGACAKFNIQDRVKDIQTPTLVIVGDQDKTFPPRWADFYKENLSNVTAKLIEQTSHNVQLEQPEELAKAIIEFGKSL